MDNTDRSSMPYTLEDLRNPEKRTICEESNSVKHLQKNLSSAISEARQTIESFKEISNNCKKDLVSLRENEEKEIVTIVPGIQSEVEKLIDHLREEMVAQNSENSKLNKQVQGLIKEKTTLLQLASEATVKVDKAETGMQSK